MKPALRILVIDDESTVRSILKMNLVSEGYEVEESSSGEAGLEKAAEFHPHLIILDLGLPDISGLEVLRRLRTWTTIPILILTVTDDEETKVKLLDAGADDYLTKPFGPSELKARVRVGLRHHGLNEATPIFESGKLHVDLSKRLVSWEGAAVKLTNTEFEVLSRLVRNQGKVVSHAQLMKEIWGAAAVEETHYLRIYINQLRKKLEANPSSPVHILTEPGVGYRLA